ncbi:hypothetical protein VNO77_25680 [Canavalia gladiata]|uniref:J domain-containing protein n=1 Tax=Canavalia gladiata TaxID=3824 RepID=A0AAN9L8L1_CANGL
MVWNGYALTTITIPPTVSDRLRSSNRIPKPVKIGNRNGAGSVKVKCSVKCDSHCKSESESESEMSFYELLGIPESGSMLEVKHAYKQLARKYHPDVSPSGRVEEYTKRFIRVHEAYETLSDPSRRAMYDEHMGRGQSLTFSASRPFYHHQVNEQKDEWKARWVSQLRELNRRSKWKDIDRENMSWGARMRQQKDELANEL